VDLKLARRAGKTNLERFQATMRSNASTCLRDVFSEASWQTIQDEAHGIAAKRFGLMLSSHPTQMLYAPAFMRPGALRTSRNRLELRSRQSIVQSRSLACWIRSSSSGLVSIASPRLVSVAIPEFSLLAL
jgi:hypothetical protein